MGSKVGYQDKHCKGCYHYRHGISNVYMCSYIFDVGKRRPCPPGKKCTVKEILKKNEKK
jgi:uncharacterized Fe-S cluster-containing MiaB family protein